MARTSSKAKKSKQEVVKSKMEKNVKVPESESEQDENDPTEEKIEEEDFEVEKIIHTRIFRGKRQYLIRWKGYDEASDTWESESAVQSCPDALEDFKKQSSTSDESDDQEQATKENKPDKNQSKLTLNEESNDKHLKKRGNKNNSEANKKKKVSSERDVEFSTVKDSDLENVDDDDDCMDLKKRENNTIGKLNKEKKMSPESDVEPSSENELDSENVSKSSIKALKRKGQQVSGKKKQKVTVSREEDEDTPLTDGKDYEVEKIIEVHSRRDGTKEFLIRWKGYSSKDDTWEPEAHLDCKELIEKFMERVRKAKDIPAKGLRESRVETQKFIPTVRAASKKHNLRRMDVRPFYQESY